MGNREKKRRNGPPFPLGGEKKKKAAKPDTGLKGREKIAR